MQLSRDGKRTLRLRFAGEYQENTADAVGYRKRSSEGARPRSKHGPGPAPAETENRKKTRGRKNCKETEGRRRPGIHIAIVACRSRSSFTASSATKRTTKATPRFPMDCMGCTRVCRKTIPTKKRFLSLSVSLRPELRYDRCRANSAGRWRDRKTRRWRDRLAIRLGMGGSVVMVVVALGPIVLCSERVTARGSPDATGPSRNMHVAGFASIGRGVKLSLNA